MAFPPSILLQFAPRFDHGKIYCDTISRKQTSLSKSPSRSMARFADLSAESIPMELAGEVAIVFCMSFVLACSVISLASAEWEGHEDERGTRASAAQSRGTQKHLAAASCGEPIRVVETMPAPKHKRITRTGKAVVRELEGKEKDEGKDKQKKREERRLSGSDEPSPSRTRSKGMRRSSSHESLTSALFEGLRRSSSHESLQLSQSSTPTGTKGMRRSSSHESLTSALFEGLRRSSSHERLQLSQSSTPTGPKGMRRSSSHESLTSALFEGLRRSSSHESLQLRQHLLSQKKKLQRLTPTRLRDNSSHESLQMT
jgi:hypothetical protein